MKASSPYLEELKGSMKQGNDKVTARMDAKGQIVIESLPAPSYTRTSAQDSQRTAYKNAVDAWNALTETEKESWKNKGAQQTPSLTGYQYFLSVQLSSTVIWYKVSIDNSSGPELTDYQIKIDISSDNQFFTDTAGKREAVRLYDSDKSTPLSYWIESWDATNYDAVIWVKVPSIPAGTTKDIHISVDTSRTEDSSDGTATFLQFHDFEDGTVGLTNIAGTWQATGDAAHDGSYGLEQQDQDGNRRGYWNTQINEEKFIVEVWMNDPSDTAFEFIYLRDSNNSAGWIVGWGENSNSFSIQAKADDTSSTGTAESKSHTFNQSTWYKFKITYKGSGDITIEADNDSLQATKTEGYTPDQIGVWCGYTKYYDTILVRKYTDTEPSVTYEKE